MKFSAEAKACIAATVIAGLLSLLCTSCSSPNRGAREMYWISGTQITEEELQHRGVYYEAYELNNEPGYCVEVSALNKFCGYTVEGTKKMIVVAAKGIVIVGIVILMIPELWLPSSANVTRGDCPD